MKFCPLKSFLLPLIGWLLSVSLLPGQTFVLANADQRCTIVLDRAAGTLRVDRLEDLTPSSAGVAIDLSRSALWRLDLRSAWTLENPNSSVTASEWMLIPSLDVRRNGGSTLATVGHGRAGSLRVKLLSSRKAELNWLGLRVGDYYQDLPLLKAATGRGDLDAIAQDTTFDVRVTLEYPQRTGGLEASLDVRLYKPNGGHDGDGVVLLSAAFPDLTLADIGGNSEDDLLLAPYQHGYLFFDPISSLHSNYGHAWKDSFLYDFGRYLANGSPIPLANGQETSRARQLLYPGEMSSQFLYYYDLEGESDTGGLSEAFLDLDPNSHAIRGLGERPSRRGPGQGIYLCPEDPDLNLKAIFFEGQQGRQGEPLVRLGMRTLVEFQSREIQGQVRSRLADLKQANQSGGTVLWQSFGLGSLPPAAPMAQVPDLHFANWGVRLQSMHGDWFDAAQVYRQFFLEKSQALHRAADGSAIPVRDLPEEVLPQVFKEDLCGIALLETPHVPVGAPYDELPVVDIRHMDVGLQVRTVQDFISFLREDWRHFLADQEAPLFSVIHGEGMTNPFGRHDWAVKSAGVENANNELRPGLSDIYEALRQPGPAWEGRVLSYVNRDTGTYYTQFPYPLLPDLPLVTRPTGALAMRNAGRALSSYARGGGAEHLQQQLADTFSKFAVGLGHSALDWQATSGQMSAAKPDYSVPQEPTRGIGGGALWAQELRALRENLRTRSSRWPLLADSQAFTSTERFHEGVLQDNLPAGHRQVFPSSVVEFDGTPKLPLMFAEPLGLTTVLYHDYTLMQGQPLSFSRYWARLFPEPAGQPNSAFLDQLTEQEQGSQFTLLRLAQQVLDLGLHPGLALNVNPRNLLEADWNQDGVFDPLTDFVCDGFSKEATAGPLDRILPGSHRPPLGLPDAARRLLRARMKLAPFLVGGQRLRDPELRPSGSSRAPFHADGILVRRYDRLDDPASVATFNGLDLQLPNLVLGAWSVPGGVDLGTGGAYPEKVDVVVPVFNIADHPVDYRLRLPLADWELQGPRTLRCFLIEDGVWKPHPHYAPLHLAPGQAVFELPGAGGHASPRIQAKELQAWVLAS